MDTVTLLGLIGGTLTTASFFPQLLKIWRTKSAHDVSIVMFIGLSIGILIWIAYGYLIGSLPVIAANVVSFIFTSLILILKVIYR